MKLHLKDKILIAAIILLTLGGCVAFARPVSFGWSDSNQLGDVAGYNFYTNGVLAQTITGQGNTSCVIDLPAGTVLCSVTAFAFDNAESDFSDTYTNRTLIRPSRLVRH